MTPEELLRYLQTITLDEWGSEAGRKEKQQLAAAFGNEVGRFVASFPRDEQREAFAKALLEHFCEHCGEIPPDERGCFCKKDD